MLLTHAQSQYVHKGALMESAKPQIIVLVILDGRVKIAQFVRHSLAVNMDIVRNHLNAIVNLVG